MLLNFSGNFPLRRSAHPVSVQYLLPIVTLLKDGDDDDEDKDDGVDDDDENDDGVDHIDNKFQTVQVQVVMIYNCKLSCFPPPVAKSGYSAKNL